MDQLLRDIRHFLWKLEGGQLEIEAGQSELHRDIANLKKSFRELMKVKENLEDMRISHMRQLEIIRRLEAKLELYKGQCIEQKKSEESETTVKNHSRCSCDGSSAICVQSSKTRKPRVIGSEKILEITSVMDTSTTHKTTLVLKKRREGKEESEGCSAVCIQSSCCCTTRISQPKSLYGLHNVENSILQRYLKDLAKYCDNNISTTTCNIYDNPPRSRRSCCSAKTNDSFSAREPRNSHARSPFPHQNSQSSVRSDSLRFRSANSVTPKKKECSKYPKKFMLKADLSKYGRFGHVVAKPNHFCNVCRQVFESRELLKVHKKVHCKVSRQSNVYKCSYCDTACGSLASSSLHSRKCRFTMRSRLNKQSL